jgi:hypothetical protein
MTQMQKTHSMVGIAACVAGVGMFVAFLIGTLYFHFAFRHPQEPWFSSDALDLLQLVVVMVLPIPVHVIGLVLGLVSLFFPQRKKRFPILAIILNLVFGICSLIPWVWLALHSSGFR